MHKKTLRSSNNTLFYWVKSMWMPRFKNGISIKWWDTHMFHRIKEEGFWVSVRKRALLANSLLESCIEEINIGYNSKFGHKVAHWSHSQKVWQIYCFARSILLCHESKQQEYETLWMNILWVLYHVANEFINVHQFS